MSDNLKNLLTKSTYNKVVELRKLAWQEYANLKLRDKILDKKENIINKVILVVGFLGVGFLFYLYLKH